LPEVSNFASLRSCLLRQGDPRQAPIENVADKADLKDVYNTEHHLLYAACTRARDHLLVTGVKPASEFLDDLLNCVPAGNAALKPILCSTGLIPC
jgi:ATP-dependent exoDNAse (exonuclease V) beta subunit